MSKQENTAKIIEHDEPTQAVALREAPSTPAFLEVIKLAITQGATVEIVRELRALQKEWKADLAREAFDEAMAAAKAEIPTIIKNRTVDFTSQKGRTHYRHEDLGEIAKTVDPILSKHGLSYRYRTTSLPNEPITVTCIVSHRLGHSEENTLSAGRDNTGNKNDLQQIGSTISYLQRYTLKAALGLAASNDDDGRATSSTGPVTDAQAKQITDLIAATKSDIGGFLKWANAESVSDIPASRFNNCIAILKAKQRKGAQQ